MSYQTYRCRCGSEFTARVADRNRGWARFCSKSCKAKEQEARTGQYAAYMASNESTDGEAEGPEWDAHKGYF